MLRAAGFEDGEAMALNATEGDVPSGRELSFAWLAGTVMTGLTSVLLMGAALYMAFLGQDTFSTPYAALNIERAAPDLTSTSQSKTNRLVAVTQTRSDHDQIEAPIRVTEEGVSRIRVQTFDRISSTLATSRTELAEDIPEYDPVALLNRTQSNEDTISLDLSTDLYGSEVQGEVEITNVALTFQSPPAPAISDSVAAEFVRLTVEGAYASGDTVALGYAAESASLIELSGPEEVVVTQRAENLLVMPRIEVDGEQLGTAEKVVTIRQRGILGDALADAGLTEGQIIKVLRPMPTFSNETTVLPGDHLRILFGPNASQTSLVPLRVSYYRGDEYRITAALSDSGVYVTGQEPPPIKFPDEDIEEINVNNLPSIYRSIWETGRKYGIEDEDIDRIVAMFAYDLDLTQRIAPGDSIDLLQAFNDVGGKDLLYVALTLDGVKREFFRHQASDGTVGFFDLNGETGKRFLTRRPLEGGGVRISSRFGYRIHPIFRTRKLHSGVDLAAPTGTPIYASGDGIIDRAQWVSGYGRYVSIKHVNGYTTAYAHQSRIAPGIEPGVRVRQGQVIGYVGSTGYSSGPHLHFEIRVNGNPVDPLSVRLPRANTLPPSDEARFAATVEQVRELMSREVAAPQGVTVAALN